MNLSSLALPSHICMFISPRRNGQLLVNQETEEARDGWSGRYTGAEMEALGHSRQTTTGGGNGGDPGGILGGPHTPVGRNTPVKVGMR